jgi:hypothetical protein
MLHLKTKPAYLNTTKYNLNFLKKTKEDILKENK